MIAIVYNLLFLMDPHESWFEKYLRSPYFETKNFKQEATKEELTSGKGCSYLAPLFEEAYSYSIIEEPNYSKMVYLLKKELIQSYCVPDKYYSFLQPNIYFYGFVVLLLRRFHFRINSPG